MKYILLPFICKLVFGKLHFTANFILIFNCVVVMKILSWERPTYIVYFTSSANFLDMFSFKVSHQTFISWLCRPAQLLRAIKL